MDNTGYVFKEEFLEEQSLQQDALENEEKTSRSEGCLRLVFIQTVVCVMLVVSALALHLLAPKSYDRLKAGYTAATTQADVTFSDIKALFGKIGAFIFSQPKEENGQTSSDIAYEENSTPAQTENETVSSSIAQKERGGAGGEDEQIKQLPESVTQNAYVLTTSISAPACGSVTSQFGWRIHPITGKQGFHTGIDIAAPLGTPITAAFSGTIAECGKNEAYGNYIIMRHSEGLYTFYGHCDSLKASEGMHIRSGEVIAYMGTTGYSTGPHLHFEIRIGGKRVDPAYVLKGIENIEF